jgi:hypothetical protein
VPRRIVRRNSGNGPPAPYLSVCPMREDFRLSCVPETTFGGQIPTQEHDFTFDDFVIRSSSPHFSRGRQNHGGQNHGPRTLGLTATQPLMVSCLLPPMRTARPEQCPAHGEALEFGHALQADSAWLYIARSDVVSRPGVCHGWRVSKVIIGNGSKTKAIQAAVRQLRRTARRIAASKSAARRLLAATGMYTLKGELRPQFR